MRARPFFGISIDRAIHFSERCLFNLFAVFKRDNSLSRGFLFCAAALLWTASVSANSPEHNWIRISTKQEGRDLHFYVENLQQADMTVTFELTLENLDASVSWPYAASFPASATTEAFTLRQRNPAKPWSWHYTYFCTWGNIQSIHDDTHVYQLPYAPGEKFEVTQGYNGKFSHFGADRFSIDWKMPVGTPIYAARGGLVASAKDDSDLGGPDKEFDWDANYILIKHSDGTYAHYAHLKKGGNKVKVGQRVRAGDLIALSGNTGYSTGPHLHFAVFKGKDGKHRQTIPVKYRTSKDTAAYLLEKSSYRAPMFPMASR